MVDKSFFEVFPTLQLKSKASDYFTDTVIKKVAATKDRHVLRIYLLSEHVIPKSIVFEVEEEIRKQFSKACGQDPEDFSVTIIEQFDLSDSYDLKHVLEIYRDSLEAELMSRSLTLYNAFHGAKAEAVGDTTLHLQIPDIFLYKDKENELKEYLLNVFNNRLMIHATISVEYFEVPENEYQKEIEFKLDLRVKEIEKKLGYGVEKDTIYIGSVAKEKGEGGKASSGKPESTGEKESPEGKKIAELAAKENAPAASEGKTDAQSAQNAPKPADSQNSKVSKFQKGGDKGSFNKGGFKSGYSRGRNNGELKWTDAPDVIYGREIEPEATLTKIEDIVGEIGEVVVQGQVMSAEPITLKNRPDSTIYTFEITDYTDSISVKIFIQTDKLKELEKELKIGSFVKVKGLASYDRFAHEITIGNLSSITKSVSFVKSREDLALHKRVELHCHTKMSDMDAVSEPKDIVKRAYKWGHRAIAITDHGVVQGFTDAGHAWDDLWKAEKGKRAEAGDKNPDRQDFFKVLYGVECYLVDDLLKVVMDDEDCGFDSEFVVFDIETTGFSPVNDRIIEIGAVKVKDGNIVDRFSVFVNPERPIPYEIEKLTSISDADVSGAETIDLVLPKFLEFCEGCVLVAHNAEFDVNYIKANCERLGYPKKFTYMDTLLLSRVQLPGHARYTLDAVAKLLNIVLGHHHRAVDDAECTALIFIKLMNQLSSEGYSKLSQINEKAGSSKEAISKMRSHHCIILAKNDLGRVHLYHLISESHLDYFSGRFPIVPKSRVQKYRDGLIVGSACEAGELYRALVEGKTEQQISRLVEFYDYLEIQPVGNNAYMVDAIDKKKLDNGEVLMEKRFKNINSLDDIRNINRRVVELGEIFHKPVVATCDVHFLDPADEVYRRIIMAGKGFDDADRQPPLYLHTTEEMLEEFQYLGPEKAKEVVVTNTNMIADMCETIAPVRPDKCPPVIPDSDKTLTDICYNRAHEIYGPELPKIVEERLERELHSIISNGFAVMYIIAQKLVWKSVEDGYLVGSRGSVGSSFVATMSGITEVNPLSPHYICPKCHFVDFDSEEVKKYGGKAGIDMPDRNCPVCGEPLKKEGFDIPFETFLGFKGDKEPDIDLNFSGEYQAKAHKYTEVIFGSGQTFRAGTISGLADKTAYGYVKKYFEERGVSKRGAEINRIVQGCMGVRTSTGQHPGGIVVLPVGEDICSFTPVQHPANKPIPTITTHFDYHSIDHNLLKLDILGHDDPTMIRMLQDLTGLDPVKDIPLDGKDVMSLFQNTDALGVTPADLGGTQLGALGIPEFGTDFAMGMLMETKPQAFSDLVRISGLSHGTAVWLGNAQDLIREGKATISTAICTRDDIMTYLISMGIESEKSFKIMEAVRKGIVAKGKSDKWPEWKEDMKAHNVPDWYIESCQKIEYMFPKAHAAAYVMMAWRIAYCKIHRPQAYYSAYFSIRAKAFSYEIMCMGKATRERYLAEFRKRKADLDAKVEGVQKFSPKEEGQFSDLRVVEEMCARGYDFVPIDIFKVKARLFQVTDDGKIMPSLTSIEGLGETVADSIVEAAKDGPFLSKQDFRERAHASQTITDGLVRLGILRDLPETNQISLFDFM